GFRFVSKQQECRLSSKTTVIFVAANQTEIRRRLLLRGSLARPAREDENPTEFEVSRRQTADFCDIPERLGGRVVARRECSSFDAAADELTIREPKLSSGRSLELDLAP